VVKLRHQASRKQQPFAYLVRRLLFFELKKRGFRGEVYAARNITVSDSFYGDTVLKGLARSSKSGLLKLNYLVDRILAPSYSREHYTKNNFSRY
jgi:hypothetical protein